MATQRPLVEFALDLRAQEVTRLTAVLAAMEGSGPGARRRDGSAPDAVLEPRRRPAAVYALLIGEGVLDDAV